MNLQKLWALLFVFSISLYAIDITPLKNEIESNKPLYEKLQKDFDKYPDMDEPEQENYRKELSRLANIVAIEKSINEDEKNADAILTLYAEYINFQAYFVAKYVKSTPTYSKHEGYAISRYGVMMTKIAYLTQRPEYIDTMALLSAKMHLYDTPLDVYPKIIANYPQITELKENYKSVVLDALGYAVQTDNAALFQKLLHLKDMQLSVEEKLSIYRVAKYEQKPKFMDELTQSGLRIDNRIAFNIDNYLEQFYSETKAAELRGIIQKSEPKKCKEEKKKNLICTMEIEEFVTLLSKKTIEGLTPLKYPKANGEFGAIGISIQEAKDKKHFNITKVFKNSPAYHKLQIGDEIVAVDSNTTQNLSLDELVELLRGKPKSKVTLTIKRDGMIEKVALQRDIVQISDDEMVVTQNDENLSLSFEDGFHHGFTKKVAKNLFKKPYKKLTLDLRKSHGGLFYEILTTLGLFLDDKQKIFYTQERVDRVDQTPQKTDSKKYDQDVEIIIDDTTQAGSLLFVYAMKKYYPKTTVTGTTNAKFGYIESVIPMVPTKDDEYKIDDGYDYLLKYRVGAFYTMDGKILSGKKLFNVVKTK